MKGKTLKDKGNLWQSKVNWIFENGNDGKLIYIKNEDSNKLLTARKISGSLTHQDTYVMEEIFEEGNSDQLWIQGNATIEGFFTLKSYGLKLFLSAKTKNTLIIDGRFILFDEYFILVLFPFKNSLLPPGINSWIWDPVSSSSIGQKVYSSEIIDLSKKGNNECENWGDFPWHSPTSNVYIQTLGQTGGLLGKIPIICGGSDNYFSYSCLIYKDEWTVHLRLPVRRDNAASLVLNETILWVTGGRSYEMSWYVDTQFTSNTSDFIGIEAGLQPGPDLPLPFKFHSMIGINSTLSMIIGGSHQYPQKYSPLTFWFYHRESKWVEAPSLNHGRQEHANGIIVDQVTKEKLVIVTGGITGKDLATIGHKGIFSRTTEVLIENQWIEGTNRYNQNQND